MSRWQFEYIHTYIIEYIARSNVERFPLLHTYVLHNRYLKISSGRVPDKIRDHIFIIGPRVLIKNCVSSDAALHLH